MKIDIDFSSLVKELQKTKGASRSVRAGILGNEKLAEIATYNEFGTENIPPRPFMRRARKKAKNWKETFKDQIYQGKNVDIALKNVGMEMKGDIQESIMSNIPPPNAPATIKRKGAGKSTLYDKGDLVNGIDYEVE